MSRLMCAVLCLMLSPILFSQEFVYSYKNKKETKEEYYSLFQEGENMAVTFKNNNYESYSLAAPDGTGLATSFNFLTRDLNMSAQRMGDKVAVSGNNGGKEVSRHVDSPLPWFTSFLHLPWFIKSDKKTMEFCIFLPQQDSKLLEMKAVKEQEETIIIMGEETHTVKVKVTLSGFLGPFWNSYFWYRTSDGIYVKSEESATTPGNGKTYTELIRVNK